MPDKFPKSPSNFGNANTNNFGFNNAPPMNTYNDGMLDGNQDPHTNNYFDDNATNQQNQTNQFGNANANNNNFMNDPYQVD